MGCCISVAVYDPLPTAEALFADRAKPDGDEFIPFALIPAPGMMANEVGVFNLNEHGDGMLPQTPVPGQKYNPWGSGYYLYENKSVSHDGPEVKPQWIYSISNGATWKKGHEVKFTNQDHNGLRQYHLQHATKQITVANNPDGLAFYDKNHVKPAEWKVVIDKTYDENEKSTADGITFQLSNDYKVETDIDQPGMYKLTLHSRVLGVLYEPDLMKTVAGDSAVVTGPGFFFAYQKYLKAPAAVYVNASLPPAEQTQVMCLLSALTNRFLEACKIDGVKMEMKNVPPELKAMMESGGMH